MGQDPSDWKTLLSRANQLVRSATHPASQLPVEKDHALTGRRDRVAQLAATDGRRAAREGRPGRLLDLHLHQLAAYPRLT